MAATPATQADANLIQRMAQGEDAALATLYDRYGSLTYSLALRILRDPGEAEEAVSDAFLQVWSQAATFDADRGRVVSWLVMITRSRALDRVRSRQRRENRRERAAVAHDEDGLASPISQPGPDPVHSAELGELRSAVGAALAELPAAQKRALELSFYGGLSHSEIAHELDEPVGTVKSRIRAGMSKLRDLLAAYT